MEVGGKKSFKTNFQQKTIIIIERNQNKIFAKPLWEFPISIIVEDKKCGLVRFLIPCKSFYNANVMLKNLAITLGKGKLLRSVENVLTFK